MNNLFDAFISYGRADSKAFATKLHVRLLEQGLKIWFDQNDIPLGVDFQNQIDDGIEKAHNFLFLIAPHSVNSPYCRKEIELALKRNKRIIPLLHVEQITWETWQQRFPQGTVEEWEAYKEKGLHSSFPNMHPAIGKINWVYFREGIDDFEQSFAGLIDLFNRQADYVEQHTQFLAKALEWERHQKQTSYLLIGEERQRAESWIKIHFKDEQAPCTPTDLHCEYITESIKNANNLMTQVFLSYADEDKETMEKIRNSLRRESITVWTNKTDIQTGEAFEEAINRGIEQADNLVFLLSPDSVNSRYCQQELDLALSLNKRVIPVLVRETDSNQIPNGLRPLQYIDLTDNVKEDDYLLDESQLLKILHQDAAYYNEHKVLLTKALKWKRQHENPSILLRGYNLRSAEAWLKVAKKRTQHPPTPLQEEFITESLRQPPASSLDVFVSYSRADSDFARKLNDSLQIQGKTTWFDQESIASGSDFQQEIYRGIKACDNFLFILSPRSVNSPYCKDEVEYAASLNKRFVTVLHREINSSDLHPELAKVQWIDFNQNERDFNANFNQLVRTLDTDREHVHSHSQWLQRALEWEEKKRSEDLLLRGKQLTIARKWLIEAEQNQKKPSATSLQKEFIAKSKQAKYRALTFKVLSGLTVGLSLTIVGLIAFVLWLFQDRPVLLNELMFSAIDSIVLSPDGKTVASASNSLDNTIQFWNLHSGERKTIKGYHVVFSPDGKTIASASDDNTIRLWNLQGKELKTLQKHQDVVNRIVFSPDGKTIASASDDGTIKLWNLQNNKQQTHPMQKNDAGVVSLAFSPDGKTIAFATDEGTIQLWNIQDGEERTLASNQD
ncbi:MAG TPA: TIR domain-containing protein [Allocoleopsis sp.]